MRTAVYNYLRRTNIEHILVHAIERIVFAVDVRVAILATMSAVSRNHSAYNSDPLYPDPQFRSQNFVKNRFSDLEIAPKNSSRLSLGFPDYISTKGRGALLRSHHLILLKLRISSL